MTYPESVIFQRTELGAAEIRSKSHELKKSERLVLVTVDGSCSLHQLKDRLRSLSAEQLERALTSLLAKGLLYELMFPVEDDKRDIIDPMVIESFLRYRTDDVPNTASFLPAGDSEAGPIIADLHVRSGMPLSSVITSNGNEGLSVNTRTDVMAPLVHPDPLTTIGGGFSALKQADGVDVNGKPVKVVQVFPSPERRKKKRKSKKIVKNTWHIYAYYALFGLGILLVLYATFLR